MPMEMLVAPVAPHCLALRNGASLLQSQREENCPLPTATRSSFPDIVGALVATQLLPGEEMLEHLLRILSTFGSQCEVDEDDGPGH